MTSLAGSPLLEHKPSRRIFEVLGDEVRFVGGCVRDSLYDKPVSDVDMATTLLPEVVTQKLQEADIHVVPTGIAFGTVTAVVDEVPIEITTLRDDIDCDGRHAQVHFGTKWEEDAKRRDFTMNALYADQRGKVYDFFEGITDLTNRRLRFIGDADTRCREDYLRILRFFRFHCFYGSGSMNEEGLAACKKYAEQIDRLSGERIQKEMFRFLEAPDPMVVLKVMVECGVAMHVFDFVPKLEALERLQQMETKLEPWLQRFGVQLHLLRLILLCKDSAINGSQEITLKAKWRLSNQVGRYLDVLLFDTVLPKLDDDVLMHKEYLRKHGRELYAKAVIVGALTGVGASSDTSSDKIIGWLQQAGGWQFPKLPISGKDVMELGIKPGRELGQLLKQAEEYWVASEYALDKAALVDYVRTQI